MISSFKITDENGIIYTLDINAEQAKALQPYVIDGIIDLDKYFFELRCYEAPEQD